MRKFDVSKGDIDEISDVNIVPVVDLALTLLIILMLLSPMVMDTMIKVVSAGAVSTTAEKLPKEKPLYIDITRTGVTLNENRMKDDDELFKKLRGELSRQRTKTVIVTVEGTVTRGRMVQILDLSKQAGAATVSLLKRKGA